MPPSPDLAHSQSLPTRTAFFYGTLMAPAVLARVTGGSRQRRQPSDLRTPVHVARPALLPGHRRHRVRDADYPAVVPASCLQEAAVRGAFVTGLTAEDLRRLDIFEGDEYERRVVRVQLLPQGEEEAAGVPGTRVGEDEGVSGEPSDSDWVETQTYIWIAGQTQLESEEWDFDHFLREKLHLWAGRQVADEGMQEIDRQDGRGTDVQLDGGDDHGRLMPIDGTRGRGVETGQFERMVNADGGVIIRSAV